MLLEQWTHEVLPKYCATIGADNEFLEEEIDLCEQCYNSFGSAKVDYIPPSMKHENGDPCKSDTKRRRQKIEEGIKLFHLVQTRQAMSMLDGGAGRRWQAMLVALDNLLEKYDKGLEAQGLEPSDLRGQLREVNEQRQADLNNMENTNRARIMSGQKSSNELRVIDLKVPEEERYAFCRQVRAEIGAEEDDLMADHSDLRQKVLGCIREVLAVMHTESDIQQLLEEVRHVRDLMVGKI